jgi:hypothetical protein
MSGPGPFSARALRENTGSSIDRRAPYGSKSAAREQKGIASFHKVGFA